MTVGQKGGLDTRHQLLAADRNGNVFQPYHLVELGLPFIDASIPGHHDADFMVQRLDGFGKCTGNVGEPAGLCKWLNFTGEKQHI